MKPPVIFVLDWSRREPGRGRIGSDSCRNRARDDVVCVAEGTRGGAGMGTSVARVAARARWHNSGPRWVAGARIAGAGLAVAGGELRQASGGTSALAEVRTGSAAGKRTPTQSLGEPEQLPARCVFRGVRLWALLTARRMSVRSMPPVSRPEYCAAPHIQRQPSQHEGGSRTPAPPPPHKGRLSPGPGTV